VVNVKVIKQNIMKNKLDLLMNPLLNFVIVTNAVIDGNSVKN
jgi:hypothetical protein